MATAVQTQALRAAAPPAARSHVAVAVVNYNTSDHLRACLQTLRRAAAGEVVVVDNASTDGSVEMAHREFPEVTVIANTRNPGYGAGANQAIRACASDYVLLLNSDTRLAHGALSALAMYLDDHPRAAVVGPRLANPDGTLQPSTYPFPTPGHVFLEQSGGTGLLRRVPPLRERYLRTWSHGRPRRVPWVLGAALALRRAAIETAGGFDESYFLYQEEVDLCYRLHAAGWEIHFAPVTTITHVGGASTGQRRAEAACRYFTSTAHFYRRYYPPARLRQLQGVVWAVMLARIARDQVRLWRPCVPETRRMLHENLRLHRQILADAGGGWV